MGNKKTQRRPGVCNLHVDIDEKLWKVIDVRRKEERRTLRYVVEQALRVGLMGKEVKV